MHIHLRGKPHLKVVGKADVKTRPPPSSSSTITGPQPSGGSPAVSGTTAVNDVGLKKKDAAPITVPEATWCDVCRTYVGTAGFKEHTQGKQHQLNQNRIAAGASDSASRTLPNKGTKHCDVCNTLEGNWSWKLHLKSKQYLTRQKYALEAATTQRGGPDGQDAGVKINEASGDGDEQRPIDEKEHKSYDDDIIVSPEDGLDFGILDRGDERGSFRRGENSFVIEKKSLPPVLLVEVKLTSSESVTVAPASRQVPTFLTAIVGASGIEIVPGRPQTVSVYFAPPYEGRFEDTFLFKFCNTSGNHSETIISRTVFGIAGSVTDHTLLRSRSTHIPPKRPPPYSPPRPFVPLKPPTWTRTEYASLTSEFPMPEELMEAQKLADKPYRREAGRIATMLVPTVFELNTYEKRFRALLWLGESHDRIAVFEVARAIEFFFTKEQNMQMPDIKIGDYALLDRTASANDTQYEARIHGETHLAVHKRGDTRWLVLRLPQEFSTYQGSVFNLRFKYNRMPMRRMHEAISRPFQFDPERLLFPALEDVPTDIVGGAAQIKLYNEGIGSDEEQLLTVRSIVHLPPGSIPFIVYGPPGSGKTATLTEAILQLLKQYSDCRVMACAPSNSAADEIVKRLSAHLSTNEMFRLNAFSRHPDDCDDTVVPYSLLNDSEVFAFPTRSAMDKFRVVVSTCNTAAVLGGLGVRRGHYSHIFIDEAAQAMEPEAVIPIAAVADNRTNVILIGDQHQLRPVVKSNLAQRLGLNLSYLARLMSMDMYNLRTFNGRTIVRLKRNRRSNEAIFAFSNSYFYEDQQIPCADPVIATSLYHSSVLPNPVFPIVFHGIQGSDMRSSSNGSFYNAEEASLVHQYCKALVTDRERPVQAEEIGVISPYKMQVRKITDILRQDDMDDIRVGSVEQFQGQERRVIIFSTVRSNKDPNKRSGMGFISDRNRLNVALTRAQALLVVIGDPAVLGRDPLWRAFLNFVHSRGGCKGKEFGWNPRDEEDLVPSGYEVIEWEQAIAEGLEMVNNVRSRIFREPTGTNGLDRQQIRFRGVYGGAQLERFPYREGGGPDSAPRHCSTNSGPDEWTSQWATWIRVYKGGPARALCSPKSFTWLDPGHYPSPSTAMMPTTPGASSAGGSTPMTYPSPWDFDAATTMSTGPQELVPQPDFGLQIHHQDVSSYASTPQSHQSPTIIQLEEGPPLPLVGQRTRARQSHKNVSVEGRPRLNLETVETSAQIYSSAVRPSSSSGVAGPSGPMRVSPVHVHTERDRSHPYRRPHSAEEPTARAPSAAGSSRTARRTSDKVSSVRFAHQSDVGVTTFQPPGSSSGDPASFGLPPPSVLSRMSPPTIVPSMSRSTLVPIERPPQESKTVYSLRGDIHYSLTTNTMTAVFELPGLNRTEVNITLASCRFTKVKQLTISGRTTPPFSGNEQEEREGRSFVKRERKYGPFLRRLHVPPETQVLAVLPKAQDVNAEMRDGVLILTIPLGVPMPPTAPETIQVR
ncbi:hypothetical protein EW146_g9665 [Bondarzewia mesenterica]|uniref:SHSP domain-containing protein n=1 Tax=Bondarzewia mesenterica TaxID=1095465 RepID=A0A4S4L4J6_9AGAM|nr:hypothetical protein EW146_g9665 [Bondarzewia mesenterica]